MENASLRLICRELKISIRTAVDWSSYCREILLVALEQITEKPLGGEQKVVEVDESNFGRFRDPSWVFGGFEQGSGRVFLVRVEKRYEIK